MKLSLPNLSSNLSVSKGLRFRTCLLQLFLASVSCNFHCQKTSHPLPCLFLTNSRCLEVINLIFKFLNISVTQNGVFSSSLVACNSSQVLPATSSLLQGNFLSVLFCLQPKTNMPHFNCTSMCLSIQLQLEVIFLLFNCRP